MKNEKMRKITILNSCNKQPTKQFDSSSLSALSKLKLNLLKHLAMDSSRESSWMKEKNMLNSRNIKLHRIYLYIKNWIKTLTSAVATEVHTTATRARTKNFILIYFILFWFDSLIIFMLLLKSNRIQLWFSPLIHDTFIVHTIDRFLWTAFVYCLTLYLHSNHLHGTSIFCSLSTCVYSAYSFFPIMKLIFQSKMLPILFIFRNPLRDTLHSTNAWIAMSSSNIRLIFVSFVVHC